MSEENTNTNEVDATRGLPPGVTTDNVSDAQNTKLDDVGVSKAPETPSNKAPEKTKDEDTKKEDTPVVKDDKTEEKKPDVEPYEKANTGDPILDAAENLLKEAGVTEEESNTWFDKVLESNNIEDLDIKAIEDKLGKDKATLVIKAIKESYINDQRVAEVKVNATYDATGGKENFETIKDWVVATSEADPKFANEMQEYADMINLGPKAAKMAGKAMLDAYNADPNNRTLGTQVVNGDGVPKDMNESLNRAEYLENMKVAQANSDHGEIKRLRAVRRASR